MTNSCKIALIETGPTKNPKSVSAHTRNSLEIERLFPETTLLVFREDFKRVWNVQFDKLIFMYGTRYYDFLPVNNFISHNEQAAYYWLTNEYGTTMNSDVYRLFRGRYSVIANYPARICPAKEYLHYHYLNLNLFLYWPHAVPGRPGDKRYGLVYYGAFRPGRFKYFKMYFQGNYVNVSTSRKNIKRFKELGCSPHFVPPIVWGVRSSLSLFRYSLYIEDELTHSNYNFPANRFYEALCNGVVQLFDRNCVTTFRIYGLEIPDEFWVRDASDLQRRIAILDKDYAHHWNTQRQWVERMEHERTLFLKSFHDILREIPPEIVTT